MLFVVVVVVGDIGNIFSHTGQMDPLDFYPIRGSEVLKDHSDYIELYHCHCKDPRISLISPS